MLRSTLHLPVIFSQSKNACWSDHTAFERRKLLISHISCWNCILHVLYKKRTRVFSINTRTHRKKFECYPQNFPHHVWMRQNTILKSFQQNLCTTFDKNLLLLLTTCSQVDWSIIDQFYFSPSSFQHNHIWRVIP